MDLFWIARFVTLTFAACASSENVVLMQTPDCDSCVWSWSTYHFNCYMCQFTGWDYPSIAGVRNRYSVCNMLMPDFTAGYLKEPNNWLRSDLIHVGEVQKVDVIVKYSINKCPDAALFCKEFFDVSVWESNTSVTSHQIPHPLNSNGSYRRFATIMRQSNNPTTSTIPLLVSSKYIVLGFRDQGGCRILYSVKVTYNACPHVTLNQSLVSVPRTLAPINESLPVQGSCTADSIHLHSSLNVLCESSGKWNTSLLEGRCICKEDMENIGGKCEDCSGGTFNDGKGLNCTVLPSHPRSVNVSFVNQTSAMITWLPPVITGGQVFYEVNCQMTCKDCDEKTCDGKAGLVSHKKSSDTNHVTITTLSSFVNYTCKIMAKNRVSEVAERKKRGNANVTTISLKTQGSVPGIPEVFVQQTEYAVTELSWQLKCKNGIIKKYHVTYFNEDDNSDKKSLATNAKETKVRIEKLAPGETFVFQVVAENNYGRGPAGEDTFKIPSDDSNSNMVIYIVAVYTVLGLVLLIVSALFGLYFYRHRKLQHVLTQSVDLSQAFQGRGMRELTLDIIEERNIDGVNHAQYMEINDIPSFELKRDDIEFIRLLGSGNFGEVFKANIGHVTVAVKSLKDPVLIVLEYLPYGDLLGYLRKSRGHSDSYHSGEKKPTSKLTANDLLSFAWMIADGMNYLAKMKIVHRDLAARNILVGENKVCKISDFGLARDVNADIYVRTSQARLPVKWMPPESLFRGESSTLSDVWSYGIVLWEVFTIGDSPYPGVKAREVPFLLEKGYRMPRPKHISKELFSIFSECWSEKPEDRPTFQWICATVKRLIEDRKTYVNLDVYNDEDYVNFDMVDKLQ